MRCLLRDTLVVVFSGMVDFTGDWEALGDALVDVVFGRDGVEGL